MKNLIIFVVSFILYASTIHATVVPDAVKTAFQTKFPNAKKVKWEKEKTNEYEAYLKFNATKNISITIKVGQSIGRTYNVFDEGDKVTFGLPATFMGGKRQQLNTNFSNGMIFQATLLYRFNLEKKP